MMVYVLRREYNLPTSEEASESPVEGVYIEEANANAARAVAVAKAQADGHQVYGEPKEGQDDADWYLDFVVDERQIVDVVDGRAGVLALYKPGDLEAHSIMCVCGWWFEGEDAYDEHKTGCSTFQNAPPCTHGFAPLEKEKP